MGTLYIYEAWLDVAASNPIIDLGGVAGSSSVRGSVPSANGFAQGSVHAAPLSFAPSLGVYEAMIGLRPFGTVDVRDYGADATGVVDATAAINEAFDAAEAVNAVVLGIGGTFKISGTVLIKGSCDFVNSTFNVDGANDFPVIIASDTTDDPAQLDGIRCRMPSVLKTKADAGSVVGSQFSWSNTDSGVTVRGLTNSVIDFALIEYFRYGLHMVSTESLIGTEHNQFFVHELNGNKRNLRMEIVEGHEGWVNENTFYGGNYRHSGIAYGGVRISGVHHIDVAGFDNGTTYGAPSHNVFYRPCIEGPVHSRAIYCEGNTNEWHAPRLETFGVTGDIVEFKTLNRVWATGNGNVVRGGLNLHKYTDLADSYGYVAASGSPTDPNGCWHLGHIGRADESGGGWVLFG